MDLDALHIPVPTVGSLRAVPWHDRTRVIEEAVWNVLAEFEGNGQQPDSWESDNIMDALHALALGNHALAVAHLQFIASAQTSRQSGFVVPRYERRSVDALKEKLQALRGTRK